MAFEPFQSKLSQARIVELPANLGAKERAALLSKLAAAVKKQAELASRCDTILRVDGTIREQGDFVVIPHEPAAALDLAAVVGGKDRPPIETIWWLTWSLTRALKASEDEKIAHGGIQPGALLRDRTGRVKLSDFGVAPAFEAVVRDCQSLLHCEPGFSQTSGGMNLSGTWRLLGDQETRERGWNSTYYPPELLQGGQRFNPRSDQFSLGATLFVLATGAHPFGADFGEPNPNYYIFVLEPYELRDERKDWKETFDRNDKGLANTADKKILTWASTVRRMLDHAPENRFKLPELDEVFKEHAPAAWEAASKTLSAAVKHLDDGDVEAFAGQAAPLAGDAAMPDMLRGVLTATVKEVEAKKGQIQKQRALQKKLDEAQHALDYGDTAQCRMLLGEIEAAAEAEAAQKSRAAELRRECDERDKMGDTAAAEFARAYLENAREYIDGGEFDAAREAINAALQQPSVPASLAEQARKLLGEIDEIAKRRKKQESLLAAATQALERSQLDEALKRASELLKDASLPPTLALKASAIKDQVEADLAKRAEYAQALDEAQKAWDDADAPLLEEQLEGLAFDINDASLLERRGELGTRLHQLKTALDQISAAEKKYRDGDAESALEALQAMPTSGLPRKLAGQRSTLITRVEKAMAEARQAALNDALDSIAKADAAYHAGDVIKAASLVKTVLSLKDALPADARSKATALQESCNRYRQAITIFQAAQDCLKKDDFGGAAAKLTSLDTKGLPASFEEEVAQLSGEIATAQKSFADKQRKRLEQRFEQAAKLAPGGDLTAAEELLAEIVASPHVWDELRAKATSLRSDVQAQKPILRTIVAAESALQSGQARAAIDFLEKGGSSSGESLGALPPDLPSWAKKRTDTIRQRLAEFEKQHRREAVEAAKRAMSEATAALANGEYAAARDLLDRAASGLEYEKTLTTKHAELLQQTVRLAEWMPKVAAIETAAKRGDTAAAYRDAADLLKKEAGVPELALTRLKALEKEIKAKIVARRKEIGEELKALTAELEQRGRKAPNFAVRAASLRDDPVVEKQQKEEAAALLAKFEALPQPKSSMMPLAVGGGVLGVAAVVVVLFMTGIIGGGKPVVTNPENENTNKGGIAANTNDNQGQNLNASGLAAGNRNENAAENRNDNLAAVNTNENTAPRNDNVASVNQNDNTAPSNANVAVANQNDNGGAQNVNAADNQNDNTAPENTNDNGGQTPQNQNGGQTVVTRPTFEDLVTTQPPVVELPRDIVALARLARAPLADALAALNVAAGESAAPLSGALGVWRKTADEPPSGTQRIALTDGRQQQFVVDVSVVYDEPQKSWKVSSAVDEAGLKAAVAGAAAAVVDKARSEGAAGKLAAAFNLIAAAEAALKKADDDPAVAGVELKLDGLPPPFEPIKGFEAGAADGLTGYPAELTDGGGAKLKLVALPPADPAWSDLDVPEAQRGWSIFYIDAAESGPFDTPDDALKAAEARQLDVPTVSVWSLAALKAGKDLQMFGGMFDWCADDRRATQFWAVGGCSILEGKLKGSLTPAPPPNADARALLDWLRSPLVTQQRAYGDGLVGGRSILRVYPK
ncbi:Protein kinase domain protein [Phycisphaerae bacterium RAS1]|nr:Protein kinase domain protein [Phycisphaerae bacterium RAS1]